MGPFQKFFGIPKGRIKTHCIISPLNESSLFSNLKIISQTKGMFFRVVDTPYATIISTQCNLLVGDCILSLKDSNCQYIYLFGSCGGIGDVRIGDKILAGSSFALESFSEMLRFKRKLKAYYPAEVLLKRFFSFSKGRISAILNCATVSSLSLEESYLNLFLNYKVSCVDMESSIVFSAANYIKRKAIALFYVSDIIPTKPFYRRLNPSERQRLMLSRRELAGLLCDFIRNF